MSCPKCNGPTEWRGSLARGGLACAKCDPDKDATAWQPGKGRVSLVMARYYQEVNAWHRGWCRSRKMAQGKGVKIDPQFCDCGFDQKTPHTEAQIEQFEIANYGRPVP